MPIAVGGTNITDIRIGSTAINSVYVGSQLVWSRMSLSRSAASGTLSGNEVVYLNDLNTSPFAPAVASVSITTNPQTSVTWSFQKNSGTTATTGTTSGHTTAVTLIRNANQGAGTSTASYSVFAYIGGSQVASITVSLRAIQDYI